FFLHSFANVSVLRTQGGLVLVDTGNPMGKEMTFEAVRKLDPAPVSAAVYTHGHVDHACGMPPFLEEARAKGGPRPRIVGHRAVAARFDRYKATAEYNGRINARQFSIPMTWPREYDYPSTVYDDTLALEVGDATLSLSHGRGETDDHTWIWWPAHRVLFT